MKTNNLKHERKNPSNYLELQEFPSIELLRLHAEEEFYKEFHKSPNFTTVSPGCFNIAGEVSNFNDGKSLCMAIQLYTVVVGRRRRCSKWCCAKTLSKEIDESNIYKFYLNTKDLEISEKPSWINYIKAAIKSYKASRVLIFHPTELIPGFNIVIASSIPIKSGLGSSTALTLAIYTFLEIITNIYTINNFEKAIACKLAEKLVTKESNFVDEPLASVIGCEDKILEIDTRTLEIAEHKWDNENIDWIFIQILDNPEASDYKKYLIQCREIAFATNVTSFRDVTTEDLSKLELSFPETYINVAKYIISENHQVSRIVKCINEKSWKKLGEILWENYFSSKYITDYDSIVEKVMAILKDVPGILGAKVVCHKFVGRLLILIRREAIYEMIKALKNISNPKYYILRPSSGIKIYADEYELRKVKNNSVHEKFCAKYCFKNSRSFSHYYANFDS